MKMKTYKLPYPFCRIGAYIRRKRFERWMNRWYRFSEQHNLNPIHD